LKIFCPTLAIFLITVASRILAATVDDYAAFDSCSVAAVNVNLAATPAKAAPGVINRVLLSVRIGKRGSTPGASNATQAPLNFSHGRTSMTFTLCPWPKMPTPVPGLQVRG